MRTHRSVIRILALALAVVAGGTVAGRTAASEGSLASVVSPAVETAPAAAVAAAISEASATPPVSPVVSTRAVVVRDVNDTRLLTQPAVSEDHIAFVYAGDLWSARIDGSDVRRLTTHSGLESRPRFSPDGEWIAFSGQYDGNTDVFVVPTEGGLPRRMTWHPYSDTVQDWTPDGSAVLFTSARQVHTTRHTQLFTVAVDGGMPERLPIPFAAEAMFSPDGGKIVYQPLSERFRQWKNYRGGTVARLWIYDRTDHSVVEIPQPEGRSNDSDPMWIGNRIFFLSDRDGEFNLFSYDVDSQEIQQHTSHEDFPILHASSGAGRILYEQAGWLHLFDPGTANREGSSLRLAVGVPTDLIGLRPRWVSDADYIRNAHVSPSGVRAVFEYRGEIVTLPAEEGDARNLTGSRAAHDRSPVWSPEGGRVAWFSDGSGEYMLHIVDQLGKEEPRTLPLEGNGFYDNPRWSPDGEWISYTDNSLSLYLLDVESGETRKISQEPYYGPAGFKNVNHSWSPDSRWLAFTRSTEADFRQVWLYDVESGEEHAVTDGLSDAYEPVFATSGKYLYFLASTDAGPVRQWFAMSNADMEMTTNIYLAVLEKGVESPLKEESDEEPVGESEGQAFAPLTAPGPSTSEPRARIAAGPSDSDERPHEPGPRRPAQQRATQEQTQEASPEGAQEEAEEQTEEEPAVEIDFECLDQRIVALPVGAASYSSLQPGPEGDLYYLRRDGQFGPGSLRRFDLDSEEEQTLADGVLGYAVTHDRQKALVAMPDDTWLIAPLQGPIDPSQGRLAVDDIEVKIDPEAEWQQIYREAWRINRDYFYDPNFHGADWEAMREKYSVFLDDVVTREDLDRVIRWMSSELAVGHHRGGGGDSLIEAESVPGGLLGADFDEDSSRYRFARVYGGLNWNPQLRSPLTQPGVDVVEGEYLLAVEGEELRPPENLYARFENTADTIVEITVGPNADGSDSRTVEVVPLGNEYSLRNRAWVEDNIARVDEATDGRVAYVYVPNTAGLGHTYFKRYFFPQAHKEAIIVDERYNGGGQVADYYIDILRRPYISHWNTRYGEDIKTPFYSIQGPKVMIIDETAGSGGDLLPWMFRKLELGTLVGKRTWGGLVGVLGFPVLMDGGSITAPNLAIWTEDGGFVVENEGVPPDIEVEQWPAEVIDGGDPQLEKAIEVALAELEANPPETYERPPYPIRVRRR